LEARKLDFTSDELCRIDETFIPQCDKLQDVFDQKVATAGEAKAWVMLRQACGSIYKPAEAINNTAVNAH
jgi:hypothetical protein